MKHTQPAPAPQSPQEGGQTGVPSRGNHLANDTSQNQAKTERHATLQPAGPNTHSCCCPCPMHTPQDYTHDIRPPSSVEMLNRAQVYSEEQPEQLTPQHSRDTALIFDPDRALKEAQAAAKQGQIELESLKQQLAIKRLASNGTAISEQEARQRGSSTAFSRIDSMACNACIQHSAGGVLGSPRFAASFTGIKRGITTILDATGGIGEEHATCSSLAPAPMLPSTMPMQQLLPATAWCSCTLLLAVARLLVMLMGHSRQPTHAGNPLGNTSKTHKQTSSRQMQIEQHIPWIQARPWGRKRKQRSVMRGGRPPISSGYLTQVGGHSKIGRTQVKTCKSVLHLTQGRQHNCQLMSLNMLFQRKDLFHTQDIQGCYQQMASAHGKETARHCLELDPDKHGEAAWEHKMDDSLTNAVLASRTHLTLGHTAHSRVQNNTSPAEIAAALDIAAAAQHVHPAAPMCDTLMCRSDDHSFVCAKVGGSWFLLDSMLDGPVYLHDATRLDTVITKTFSIWTLKPAEHPELYHERQDRAGCFVHAINMLTGCKALQLDPLLRRADSLLTKERTLIDKAKNQLQRRGAGTQVVSPVIPSLYDKGRGNFAAPMLNALLQELRIGTLPMHLRSHKKPAAYSSEALERLIPSASAGAPQGLILDIRRPSYNHAVVLRKGPEGTWALLDSERTTVQTIEGHNLHTKLSRLQINTIYSLRHTTPEQQPIILPAIRLVLSTPTQQVDENQFLVRPTQGPDVNSPTPVKHPLSHNGPTTAHNRTSPVKDRPPATQAPAPVPTGTPLPTATADTQHPTTPSVTPHQQVPAQTEGTKKATKQQPPAATRMEAPKKTRVNSKARAMQQDKGQRHRQLKLTEAYKPKATQVPDPNPTQHPVDPGDPAATTDQAAPARPGALLTQLTLATFNVRGLCKAKADVQSLLDQASPDVLVLTETKLGYKQDPPSWLASLLSQYYWGGSRCMSKDQGPTAGVIIAVKHHLAAICTATLMPCNNQPGRIAAMTLQPPGSQQQLQIIGAYWPADGNRKDMDTAMSELITQHEGPTLILGDMNAAGMPEDRLLLASKEGEPGTYRTYPCDQQHRTFMETHDLRPLQTQDRQHTFSSDKGTTTSRIDDIIGSSHLCSTIQKGQVSTHFTWEDQGAHSDHSPLVLRVPAALISPDIPAPCNPPPRKLVQLTTLKPNPPAAQVQLFQAACRNTEEGITRALTALNAALEPALQAVAQHNETQRGDTANGKSKAQLTGWGSTMARDGVEQLAELQDQLLRACHALALRTLPTTRRTVGRVHYRGRQVSKIRAAKAATRGWLRHMRTRLIQGDGMQTTEHADLPEMALTLQPAPGHTGPSPATRNAAQILLNEALEKAETKDARQILNKAIAAAGEAVTAVDKEERKKAIEAGRAAQQAGLDNNQRRTTQKIFKGPAAHRAVTAVRKPDGTLATDPVEMGQAAQAYYRQAWGAKTPKTGQYLPKERTRTYPFTPEQGQPDPFHLSTPASKMQNRPWLHPKLTWNTFHKCLRQLPSKKQPGPDGIPNELLKALPQEVTTAMYQLCTVLWATGLTPDSWKISKTVLLDKGKPDTANLQNYRPIGLANTQYKLWTRLITTVILNYAEQYALLSYGQAGFRRFQNTIKQVQRLLMGVEDARLAGRDLYLLLIDFSSAFNTTDQDATLAVMYDLGIPTDAIEVVKDLYTGARTVIHLGEITHTLPVHITRGTIQGDCLSPLLFLFSLEPLLRWLHVGGRGYEHACLDPARAKAANLTAPDLPTADTFHHRLSGIALADDLACATSTRENLQVQAKKVSEWSNFMGLDVNSTKSLVTGALHSRMRQGRDQHDSILRSQLYNAITLQGNAVTYLPYDQPYDYLGVRLTMSMDWAPQHKVMTETLQLKLTRLSASAATPRQALRIVKTAVMTSLAYAFPVVPCTPADIDVWDNLISSFIRRRFGLMQSAPTAFIRESTSAYGLDCESLAVEYHARNAKALVESLWDKGSLGLVTYHLLDAQAAHLGRAPAHAIRRELQTNSKMRQLLSVHQSGLQLVYKGQAIKAKEAQQVAEMLATAGWRRSRQGGLQAHLHDCTLRPLMALGITGLHELMEANGKYLITGTELKNRYRLKGADRTAASTRHVKALNRLAAIMRLPQEPSPEEIRDMLRTSGSSKDMCQEDRAVRPGAGGITSCSWLRKQGPWTWQATAPQSKQLTLAECLGPQATQAMAALRARSVQAVETSKRPTYAQPDTLTAPAALTAVTTAIRPLETYRERHAQNLREKNGADTVVTEMFRWQDIPRAIKGKQAGTQHQTQYLVEWEPSIIPRWALDIYKDTRYKPASITPVSREDTDKVKDHACVCEICSKPNSLTHSLEEDMHDDMPICDTCERCYHMQCLTDHSLNPAAIPTDQEAEWHCPACSSLDDTARTTRKQEACAAGEHSELVECTWPWTWEDESVLSQHADMQDLIAAFQAEHARGPSRKPGATPDSHLPDSVRQSMGPNGRGQWQDNEAVRSKVTFLMEPVNPQLDVQPLRPPACAVLMRPVACLVQRSAPPVTETTDATTQPSQPNARPQALPMDHLPEFVQVEAVTAHDCAGRCQGVLTNTRATWLHTQYEACKDRTEATLDFATELVGMLARHTTSDLQRLDYQAPAGLITQLRTHTGITMIRGFTPLTCDTRLPYSSYAERDGLFGASHTCMASQWSGISFAAPLTDKERASQMTLHALHSAGPHAKGVETPVATFLLVPDRRNQGKTRMWHWLALNPHLYHVIGTFNIGSLEGEIPSAWYTSLPKARTNGVHLKLIVVWNTAGRAFLQQHKPGWKDALIAGLNSLTRDGKGFSADPQPCTTSQTAKPIPGLAGFKKLPAQADRTPQEQHADRHRPPPAWAQAGTNCTPVIPNWTSAAYVDGSCLKEEMGGQKIGAGIAVPGLWQQHRGALTVNPNGEGITNTINRAELAGLLGALVAINTEDTRMGGLSITHVGSDSLTAMCQVRKVLEDPMALTSHKHRDLLLRIMSELSRLREPITIFKVKAHTGLVGNEAADMLAKWAAEHQPDTDLHIGVENQPFRDSVCLQTPAVGETEPRLITDMSSELKHHMRTRHRLGAARQNGMYYRSYQNLITTKQGKRKPAADTRCVAQLAALPFVLLKCMLQFRTGCLYNQKLAYRFRRAPNRLCLCCNNPDSATHKISGAGCHPQLQAMGTDRHDGSTRLMWPVVAAGELGHCIAFTDTGVWPGRPEVADEEQIDAGEGFVLRAGLPRYLFGPDADKVWPKELRSYPDGILALPEPGHRAGAKLPRHQRRLLLVEVKYTSDTRYEEKLDQIAYMPGRPWSWEKLGHARGQHEALHAALAKGIGKYCASVEFVPILLGYGGTIYTEHTLEALQRLGVHYDACQRLAAALVKHAATSAKAIIGTSRALARTAG